VSIPAAASFRALHANSGKQRSDVDIGEYLNDLKRKTQPIIEDRTIMTDGNLIT